MSTAKNKAYRTTTSFQMGSKYYSKHDPFNPADHQSIEVEKQLKRGLIELAPAKEQATSKAQQRNDAAPVVEDRPKYPHQIQYEDPTAPHVAAPDELSDTHEDEDYEDEDEDDDGEEEKEAAMTSEKLGITPPVRRSPGRPKSTHSAAKKK